MRAFICRLLFLDSRCSCSSGKRIPFVLSGTFLPPWMQMFRLRKPQSIVIFLNTWVFKPGWWNKQYNFFTLDVVEVDLSATVWNSVWLNGPPTVTSLTSISLKKFVGWYWRLTSMSEPDEPSMSYRIFFLRFRDNALHSIVSLYVYTKFQTALCCLFKIIISTYEMHNHQNIASSTRAATTNLSFFILSSFPVLLPRILAEGESVWCIHLLL